MVEACGWRENAVPLTHSHVVSDVGAGTALLEGALKAVLFNVDVNLPSLADAEMRAAWARACGAGGRGKRGGGGPIGGRGGKAGGGLNMRAFIKDAPVEVADERGLARAAGGVIVQAGSGV